MSAKQIVVTVRGTKYRAGKFENGRKAISYLRRIRERLEESGYTDLKLGTELHYHDGGENHQKLVDAFQAAMAGLSIPTEISDTEDSDDGDRTDCPKCGSSMNVQERKRDGVKFWGCSNFPRCKGTRNYTEPTTTETTTVKPTTAEEVITDGAVQVPTDLAAALGPLRDLFGGMDAAKIEALVQTKVDAKMKELALPKRKTFKIPEIGEIDPGPIQHPKFETLLKLISGGATRIWINGDAGMGKTHACFQICDALDLPYYVITPVTDKYELFGYKDANGNYQETQLYRFVRHEGPCVLILDEVDGCHPNALVAANSTLANGLAVFPDGQHQIDDRKIVVATANTTGEGPTLRYNARLAQDGALLDRFAHFVHFGLDNDTELQIALDKHGTGAREAVEASWVIRQNITDNGIDVAWGPRRTFAMAEAVARCGFKVRDAAKLAGIGKLDKQQTKLALAGV
jgi:MoxR-like ATPase